jgi:hypothetical protein
MFKKLSLLVVSVMISLQVQAQISDFQLSKSEEDQLLTSLNNICGDIWCEGDYELNFTSIELVAKPVVYYKFNFTASQYINDHETAQFFACEIQDVELVQKLVHKKPHHEEETELNNLAFYNMIDECINIKLK